MKILRYRVRLLAQLLVVLLIATVLWGARTMFFPSDSAVPVPSSSPDPAVSSMPSSESPFPEESLFPEETGSTAPPSPSPAPESPYDTFGL